MAIHSGADGTRSVGDSEPAYNVVGSSPYRGFQYPELRDPFVRQKGQGKDCTYLLCLCLLVFMLYFEKKLAVNSLTILTHSQAKPSLHYWVSKFRDICRARDKRPCSKVIFWESQYSLEITMLLVVECL